MAAAAISTGMQIASTVLGARAANQEGEAAQVAAEFNAKNQFAQKSREAHEEKRKGDILMSNARAAMAAGGGSTMDSGNVYTLSEIGRDANYNALSALYEGEQAAEITRYEGRLKKRAAKGKAIGTVLSGAGDIYKSFKLR